MRLGHGLLCPKFYVPSFLSQLCPKFYVPSFLWHVITHPRYNVNGGLVKAAIDIGALEGNYIP